jgi:hypothetical protein
MQVMPKYAAASPINIGDVGNADGNVHAAAKMLCGTLQILTSMIRT